MSKDSSNPFLRLSTVAIQMAAVIGLFTWLGVYLDNKYHFSYLFTVILGLTGVGIGLYLVIKEVQQLNNEN